LLTLDGLILYSERNQRALLGLLFDARAATLLEFGRDDLGGQVGFTYRDRQDGDRRKTDVLPAEQFPSLPRPGSSPPQAWQTPDRDDFPPWDTP
jgi:hypothetical protein